MHVGLGKPLNSSRWRGGCLNGAEGAISTKQNTCLYWAFNEAIVCACWSKHYTYHWPHLPLQTVVGLISSLTSAGLVSSLWPAVDTDSESWAAARSQTSWTSALPSSCEPTEAIPCSRRNTHSQRRFMLALSFIRPVVISFPAAAPARRPRPPPRSSRTVCCSPSKAINRR